MGEGVAELVRVEWTKAGGFRAALEDLLEIGQEGLYVLPADLPDFGRQPGSVEELKELRGRIQIVLDRLRGPVPGP
jgi:hypothetical protein